MKFTSKMPRRIALSGAALVAGGAIGVTVLGTSQADDVAVPPAAPAAAVAPAVEPIPVKVEEREVWTPRVSSFAAAGSAADASDAQAAFARSRIASGANATKARVVPDPSGESKGWTIAPTADGACLIPEDGRTLCAHGQRLAQAGASVSWSVPSPVEQQAGTGSYAFRGIAVDDVDTISVINEAGDVVEKTSPKGSVFSITVPASAKPTGLRVSGGGKVTVIQVG